MLPYVIVAVSVIAAVAGLIFANPPLLGFAVGLIATVIGLQLELMARVQQRAEARDQGGKLLAELDDLPEMVPEFTAMAATMRSSLERSRSEMFRTVTQEFVTEEVERLRERLSKGRFEEGPDTGRLTRFVQQAHKSVKTTCLVSAERTFWDSVDGQSYWKANRAAVDRGLQVERIFIHDGDPKEVTGLARHQQAGGVNALAVDRGALEQRGRDMVLILDDEVVQWITLNDDGTVASYEYRTGEKDVTEAKQYYHRIRQRAAPVRT